MKTIVILNLKGGVGKTTTATNLAYELSNIGETLLIDADNPNTSAPGGCRVRIFGDHPRAHRAGRIARRRLRGTYRQR